MNQSVSSYFYVHTWDVRFRTVALRRVPWFENSLSFRISLRLHGLYGGSTRTTCSMLPTTTLKPRPYNSFGDGLVRTGLLHVLRLKGYLSFEAQGCRSFVLTELLGSGLRSLGVKGPTSKLVTSSRQGSAWAPKSPSPSLSPSRQNSGNPRP